jgi:hypothetical protein
LVLLLVPLMAALFEPRVVARQTSVLKLPPVDCFQGAVCAEAFVAIQPSSERMMLR